MTGPPLFPSAISGEGGLGDKEGRFADNEGGLGDSEGRFADSEGGLGDNEGRFADNEGGLGDGEGRFADSEGRLGDGEGFADVCQSENVEVKVKDVVCNEPSTSSGHDTKEDE